MKTERTRLIRRFNKFIPLIEKLAKKEVFDDIRNRFNSKHQCSSCDYGIMEYEMVKLEKHHLSKTSPNADLTKDCMETECPHHSKEYLNNCSRSPKCCIKAIHR